MTLHSDQPILIIGGGLAGLACARTLEGAGRTCVVFEKAKEPGGRVQTDRLDGFLLDRGFQIYLDSYPQGEHFFTHEALALKAFDPGALIKMKGRSRPQVLADPFRQPGKAIATALSKAATFGDKLKIAKLRKHVNGQSLESLLEARPQSTLEFLREFGFSDRIIDNFFRPFYGGITLDRELTVSSRFFLWSFRLFGSGRACVPAAGMDALPRQISKRLRTTEFKLETEVRRIDGTTVITDGGQRVEGSAVVIATEAPTAAELLRMAGRDVPDDFAKPAKENATLYFAGDAAPFDDKLILLAGDEPSAGPINSIAVMSNVSPSYAPAGKSLLSVSVVDSGAMGDDLEAKVTAALPAMLGDDAGRFEHLRTYRIPYSLPDQAPPALQPPHQAATLDDGLLICGDHRDTASINGALLSGRRAAETILRPSTDGEQTSPPQS